MARCKSHRTREATPMPLPPEMVVLLAAFAPLFSDRVWAHAQILAIGAILVTGKRTVTSALRIMGLSHEAHFTNYHRVLNRAAWGCPPPWGSGAREPVPRRCRSKRVMKDKLTRKRPEICRWEPSLGSTAAATRS